MTIDAAYFNGNSGGTVRTPTPTTLAFVGRTVGIVYRWGELTTKASITTFNVAGSFNETVYSAGLDDFVLPTLLNAGVWVTRNRDHSDDHSILGAVGAEYYLSKQTTVYSQIGVVDNHGAINTGLSVSTSSTLYGGPGTTVGANVGLRHMF
ncbi:hypothetical protein [Paraburkholderia tropica]|uniref:hypothetical protein n=1 Tax=Paraburkholderia tropica TaxID=92647 RepID=UPI0007EC5BD7|nr:hypothetical protein [Paraburkholderia tropica]OBR54117.1 hypothetical protein A6456_38250 [Paraburkholderia tropica]